MAGARALVGRKHLAKSKDLKDVEEGRTMWTMVEQYLDVNAAYVAH